MPMVRFNVRSAEFRDGFVTTRPLQVALATEDRDCKRDADMSLCAVAIGDAYAKANPSVSFIISWKALGRNPIGAKNLRSILYSRDSNA